jgi:hypothetical protein
MGGKMRVSKEHEDALASFIGRLQSQGYRVVKMHRKLPDAVATKDGKLYAVEIIGQKWSPNDGWKNTQTFQEKKVAYSMFDGVLIEKFKYAKRDAHGFKES